MFIQVRQHSKRIKLKVKKVDLVEAIDHMVFGHFLELMYYVEDF
jgi:hypothetical protein